MKIDVLHRLFTIVSFGALGSRKFISMLPAFCGILGYWTLYSEKWSGSVGYDEYTHFNTVKLSHKFTHLNKMLWLILSINFISLITESINAIFLTITHNNYNWTYLNTRDRNNWTCIQFYKNVQYMILNISIDVGHFIVR